MKFIHRACFAMFTVCIALWIRATAAEPKPPDPKVQFAMSDSLFGEGGAALADAHIKTFADLVNKQTAVDGDFRIIEGIHKIAQAFKDGKIHIAVVQGHEYGWLRQQYDDLRPLMIAVAGNPVQRAMFLVPHASKAKTASDLRGETLAMAKHTPYFAQFYLRQFVSDAPADYFKTVTMDSVDDAIEEVVEGNAAVTMISETAMHQYQARKPGRFKRLRVLEQSPDFPAAVLVYLPEPGREKQLEKVRAGLLKADQSPDGRLILTLWRLSKFAEVPKDYETVVTAIVKQYPAPKR